ncbi:MAG: hypothetical protein BYD32DRAFT_187220 [Podila humilis]|nr:MAG: hypothetical protein BYD32DRAFT_187220 [Podila humilis]
MATYKQRTPYYRHAATDRHASDNDSQTLQTIGTTRYHSSTATPSDRSYLNEDTILDKTSGQEWASIRHTASARARARQQQQYFDQQQQRTREWQFVLGQHHHRHTSLNAESTSTDAGRPISSDEYDEVLTASSTEPPSLLDSPQAVDARALGESSFEQTSVLGYSDLTSEGLDSVGDSEELDVWSQDDEESISLFTPTFRRPSGPASPSELSPSTSMFYLPRPSFAGPLFQPNPPVQPRFQNQMPLHDGSGNFTEQSPQLPTEPGHGSDHGPESIALGASSVLRRFGPQHDTTRPRISSSDFASVIQNIASLQVQAGSASRSTSRPVHPSPIQSNFSDNDCQGLSLRLSSTPICVTPALARTQSNRALKMYDADEQELTEMIAGIPSKLSWLQAFEQTLHVFADMKDSGFNITVGDTCSNNAVNAWAICISHNECTLPPFVKAVEETDSESDARLGEIRKNMASASLDTLRRLQMRKRSHSPTRKGRSLLVHSVHPLDPMQIHFTPTIMDPSKLESSRHPKNRRITSRSTSTSTSHPNSNMQDSTLLSVFITTLRRLRDHVSSNFIYHDYLDGDDNSTPSAPSGQLGFQGDLGIEWATGGGTSGTSASTLSSHDHHEHVHARRNWDKRHRYNPDRRSSTTPRSSSSSMSSSFRRTSSVRRASSDCGRENMRHYSRSQERMHRPLYVD